MRWFERHRMDWIAETLHVFGFINRSHIMRKFEISTPQASSDLKTFKKMHPGAIEYDESRKTYVLVSEIAP